LLNIERKTIEKFCEELNQSGLECSLTTTIPLHKHKLFRENVFNITGFNNSSLIQNTNSRYDNSEYYSEHSIRLSFQIDADDDYFNRLRRIVLNNLMVGG
jgi:hypothetical protein